MNEKLVITASFQKLLKPILILSSAITVQYLLTVGDPGCYVVSILDMLDLVYASVHSPDIPPHRPQKAICVCACCFKSQNIFLNTGASFPLKGASLFLPLSFVLPSQSASFCLVRPHHPPSDTFVRLRVRGLTFIHIL